MKLFSPSIRKGLYHYGGKKDFEGLRLHLRIEEDGSGVLVVNASRMLFLNRTAAEYIFLFMEGRNEDEAIAEIKKRFKVDVETARKDYREILYTINTFAKTADIDPITYLGVDKMEPFQKEVSAPYRMDLALTYRCDNECVHCYAGGPHETKELKTEEWYKVLDRLHEIGVPHVVFTGGEPTLREDLKALIAYTQKKEFVSGLVTNGRRLKDAAYLKSLIDAGLDHIQITIESHDEKIHDRITRAEGSWNETVQGIKNAIDSPVYTITNTTLNRQNIDGIKETVHFLHELGVEHFACNGLIYSGNAAGVAKEFGLEESSLRDVLGNLKDFAAKLGMELIWYTPTQYCEFNPLEFELGIKTCSACRISMCIEPDGNVIPCQSYFKPLGNILTEDWKKIWNNPLCREIRSRKYAPEKCDDCPQLPVCGAGCPLKLQNDSNSCRDVP
jgi:radical SAM protein with 4Fe4S-binding SPASM domain